MLSIVHFAIISLLLLISSTALGNTDILNFSVFEESDLELPFVGKWPVLYPGSNEIRLNVTAAALGTAPESLCSQDGLPRLHSCPHEFWVVLDLGNETWVSYTKFTLRLSWPASYPVDTYLSIYGPETLATFIWLSPQSIPMSSAKTRRKYARVQVINTGVPTPSPESSHQDNAPMVVPLMLIVEPLLFGVLPTTVVPTIYFIIAFLVLGVLVYSKVIPYLEEIATRIRMQTHKDKQKQS